MGLRWIQCNQTKVGEKIEVTRVMLKFTSSAQTNKRQWCMITFKTISIWKRLGIRQTTKTSQLITPIIHICGNTQQCAFSQMTLTNSWSQVVSPQTKPTLLLTILKLTKYQSWEIQKISTIRDGNSKLLLWVITSMLWAGKLTTESSWISAKEFVYLLLRRMEIGTLTCLAWNSQEKVLLLFHFKNWIRL